MSVTQTALDNGVRVVSDRMESAESVSIGVWVNAGARNEDTSNNGVSHLLEHMAFKGTSRRSALAIAGSYVYAMVKTQEQQAAKADAAKRQRMDTNAVDTSEGERALSRTLLHAA